MAWDVADTIRIYAIRDSKRSRQWERLAPQIWPSSWRSIASLLTHRTARESSGAAEGLFRPDTQPQFLHLRRGSLTDIPRKRGCTGEHIRFQRESHFRATHPKT